MGKIKVAFFDAKEYDRQSFMNSNKDEEFEILYLETRLSEDTCKLADGYDVELSNNLELKFNQQGVLIGMDD